MVPVLSRYFAGRVQGIDETSSQDCRYTGRDLNPGTPEYDGILLTEHCSDFRCCFCAKWIQVVRGWGKTLTLSEGSDEYKSKGKGHPFRVNSGASGDRRYSPPLSPNHDTRRG
jgi:hypothetical protein